MATVEEVLAELGIRVTPGSDQRVVADSYAGPAGPGITILEESPIDPLEPLRFVLRVDPAGPAPTGGLPTAARQVREQLQRQIRRDVKQSELRIGEHPAVEMADLPGREGSSDVVVVQAFDQLYRITRAGTRDFAAPPPRVNVADVVAFERPLRARGSLRLPTLEESLRPPQTASRRLEVEDYPPAGFDASGTSHSGPPVDAPPTRLRALPNCVDYAGPSPLQTPWSAASSGPTGAGRAAAGPSHFSQGFHKGCNAASASNDRHAIDYEFHEGAEVLPNAAGTVTFAGWAGGGWGPYGRIVIIDIGGGFFSLSAHLEGIAVSAGQRVGLNTVIGWIGRSGNQNHAHWQVPHLHNVIYLNASVETNADGLGRGGIFGGQGVEPRNVRFFANGGGTIDRIAASQILSW
jgi:murein DD-endopeptidase MepM/ murein hydrolase activator NlpD